MARKSPKKKIIIIGGGGHARVLRDILGLQNVAILGFMELKETEGMGVKYLGHDSMIKRYPPGSVILVNGIGSIKPPYERREVYERFKRLGYAFLSVVHPKAIVASKVKLGEGVQIMGGVVINTGTVIKDNVIVNTSSSVDHDCSIGAHTHIAPGVTLSGDVTIGECCHVGTGAKIIQGVTVEDEAFIIAGAVIIQTVWSDEKADGIYYRANLPTPLSLE